MGLHAASRRLRHVSWALGPPQPPSASPTAGAGQEQEELRAVLDRHADSGFTGAVSVCVDGAPVLREGVGEASIELAVPNAPSTIFRIGSCSKQFTALAILLLADRGVLRVSDSLGARLYDETESAPHWRPLTVHQLLTHTSGICHSWALPFFTPHMAVPLSLQDNIARFHEEPLLFKPGAEGEFSYSGLGYFLLARLVEVRPRRPHTPDPRCPS